MLGMLAHGRELQGERLLVVGGDAGIEADAHAGTPLAKNPPAAALGKPRGLRGFGHRLAVWLKTIVYSHTVQPPIPQEHPCPDKKSSHPPNTLNY